MIELLAVLSTIQMAGIWLLVYFAWTGWVFRELCEEMRADRESFREEMRAERTARHEMICEERTVGRLAR